MNVMKLMAVFLGVALAWSVPARADSAKDLAFVQGVWTSKVEFRSDDGEWGKPVEGQAMAHSALGGSMYEIDAIVPFPGATFMMRMMLGYDRFNKAYRLVVLDDINGFIDFYSGQKDVDGSIIVDNGSTGTAIPNGKGGKVMGKIRIAPTQDGWVFSADIAPSKEGPWKSYMRMTFSPRK